jgi:hypothetical protein
MWVPPKLLQAFPEHHWMVLVNPATEYHREQQVADKKHSKILQDIYEEAATDTVEAMTNLGTQMKPAQRH